MSVTAPGRPEPLARFDLRPRAAEAAGSRWSRLVGLLKFGLPAAALAVGALVVIWPDLRHDQSGFPIPIAEPRAGEDESLRMANPRYTGADDNNRPYAITADSATIDRFDRGRVSLDHLHADLTMEDGSWVSLAAPNGIYWQDAQRLALTGPIEVFSDTGYELHARSARIDMRSGIAESDDAVDGHGPLGILSAHSFRVDRRAKQMSFGGGVKLTIFTPSGAG